MSKHWSRWLPATLLFLSCTRAPELIVKPLGSSDANNVAVPADATQAPPDETVSEKPCEVEQPAKPQTFEHLVWAEYESLTKTIADFEREQSEKLAEFKAAREKKLNRLALNLAKEIRKATAHAEPNNMTAAYLEGEKKRHTAVYDAEAKKLDDGLREFEERQRKARSERQLLGLEQVVAQAKELREQICAASAHSNIAPAIIASNLVMRRQPHSGKPLGESSECATKEVRGWLRLGADAQLDTSDEFITSLLVTADLQCEASEFNPTQPNPLFGLLYSAYDVKKRVAEIREKAGVETINDVVAWLSVGSAYEIEAQNFLRRTLTFVLAIQLGLDDLCAPGEVKVRHLAPFNNKENGAKIQAQSILGLNSIEWHSRPADHQRYLPPEPAEDEKWGSLHEMASGDTPSLVAMWYYTTVQKLSAQNDDKNERELATSPSIVVPSIYLILNHDLVELAHACYPHLPHKTAVSYFFRINTHRLGEDKVENAVLFKGPVKCPKIKDFKEPAKVKSKALFKRSYQKVLEMLQSQLEIKKK